MSPRPRVQNLPQQRAVGRPEDHRTLVLVQFLLEREGVRENSCRTGADKDIKILRTPKSIELIRTNEHLDRLPEHI